MLVVSIFYLNLKIICIPESFNTNISQQLFDNTITFVNSQQNSKVDFDIDIDILVLLNFVIFPILRYQNWAYLYAHRHR